jgi:hypothetical protein
MPARPDPHTRLRAGVRFTESLLTDLQLVDFIVLELASRSRALSAAAERAVVLGHAVVGVVLGVDQADRAVWAAIAILPGIDHELAAPHLYPAEPFEFRIVRYASPDCLCRGIRLMRAAATCSAFIGPMLGVAAIP